MTEDESQDDKLDMIRQMAEALFGKKDKYTSEQYGLAVTSLLKSSKKRKPRTPKKDKPPKATKTDPTREEYRKKIEQVVDNFTENGWAIPHGVVVETPKKADVRPWIVDDKYKGDGSDQQDLDDGGILSYSQAMRKLNDPKPTEKPKEEK